MMGMKILTSVQLKTVFEMEHNALMSGTDIDSILYWTDTAEMSYLEEKLSLHKNC